MAETRVEIRVPEREYPQNKEGVLHWCKQPGDAVAAGECLCEAEIEKKIFEVPAPAAGVLESCCVAEEAEFKCSQVLGYLLCHG